MEKQPKNLDGEWKESDLLHPIGDGEKFWNPDEFEDLLVWVRLSFPADSGHWCILAQEPAWQRFRDDIPDLWTWMMNFCRHPYYLKSTTSGLVIEVDPQDAMLFKLRFGKENHNRPEWLDKNFVHKNQRHQDGSA